MDISKILKLIALGSSLIIGLSACNNSTTEPKETAYQKRNQTLALETEPASFRKYALVSSGDINVQNSFATDGPLADVHSNGAINARSLSLDISGRVTAANNPNGAIVRSFNYDSPLDKQGDNKRFVQIRALKVSEYLNTNNLDEYYLLTADGEALYKQQGLKDTDIANSDIEFSFENNQWTLTTNQATLNAPLVVEASLSIQATNLFIAGTLMVKGNLDARGELNINTGTPFEKALIVDRNISVEKLVTIGRLHGSGSFTSYGEVNILGNAEIDGEVNLYGDAKINFLDNIFKAALYEAQEEASEEAISMTLVHSQLFSDVKGKNSVVLFTFVEGDYILNENVLNALIENDQIDDFKFKSYLYGASIDYGAQLQKFDGLSPYFANKQAILKKLADQGYSGIKISESLDIAPSNLYHSFKDQHGNLLGTYQVYSLANPFNQENPMMLTQEDREGAIYAMDNKAEIEQQQEDQAKEQFATAKQEVIASDDYDEETKTQLLSEMNDSMDAEKSVDKIALEKEATQDRVNEWVEYKDLATESKEVEVEEIIFKKDILTRRFFKQRRSRFRNIFYSPRTFHYCPPIKMVRTIKNVKPLTSWPIDDWWFDSVSINNDGPYCSPAAFAMILQYHSSKRLYSFSEMESSRTNPLVKRLGKKFLTNENGTNLFSIQIKASTILNDEFKKFGMGAEVSTSPLSYRLRVKQNETIIDHIRSNNPIIFHADSGNTIYFLKKYNWRLDAGHSMPVIGYKAETKPTCRRFIVSTNDIYKMWVLVDIQFQGIRSWVRINGAYTAKGRMTYVKTK